MLFPQVLLLSTERSALPPYSYREVLLAERLQLLLICILLLTLHHLHRPTLKTLTSTSFLYSDAQSVQGEAAQCRVEQFAVLATNVWCKYQILPSPSCQCWAWWTTGYDWPSQLPGSLLTHVQLARNQNILIPFCWAIIASHSPVCIFSQGCPAPGAELGDCSC